MPNLLSSRPARLTVSPEAHGGVPVKTAQPQAFLSLP